MSFMQHVIQHLLLHLTRSLFKGMGCMVTLIMILTGIATLSAIVGWVLSA